MTTDYSMPWGSICFTGCCRSLTAGLFGGRRLQGRTMQTRVCLSSWQAAFLLVSRVETPGPQVREQALHSVLCFTQPGEGLRGGPGRTPRATFAAPVECMQNRDMWQAETSAQSFHHHEPRLIQPFLFFSGILYFLRSVSDSIGNV